MAFEVVRILSCSCFNGFYGSEKKCYHTIPAQGRLRQSDGKIGKLVVEAHSRQFERAQTRFPAVFLPSMQIQGGVCQYNYQGLKQVGIEFIYWLAMMQCYTYLLCITLIDIAIFIFPQGRFRSGISRPLYSPGPNEAVFL